MNKPSKEEEAARPTHHNTCPRGERCACYLTGYTDAEYDHGLALDKLPAAQPQRSGQWTKNGEFGIAVKLPPVKENNEWMNPRDLEAAIAASQDMANSIIKDYDAALA